MIYRKFTADAIFDGYRFLTDDEVLVTDEEGRIIEIVAAGDSSDVQRLSGTISPGLINSHCHLELSWMKGKIARNTGMIDFLLGVMQMPAATSEVALTAVQEAEKEMLDSGIVAVGDICNTSLTIARKKERNLYYHNFIEVMGFVPASAKHRFAEAIEVFNQFAAEYPLPVACNSIVPHAPYSVSEELFRSVIQFPGNQLLSIHNQEHAAENDFFMQGGGEFHRLFRAIGVDSSFHSAWQQTSLQRYLPWFLRNQQVILVHNVETATHDLQQLNEIQKHGVNWWLCLCPNANLFISGKLPDIALLRKYTDRLVIGTDSLASNTKLNIIEEMKTIHKTMPEISVGELLKWGTINGAKALQIEDEVGSFEPGKQPGIVVLTGVHSDRIDNNAASYRLL